MLFNFILTLAPCLILGYLLRRLKVPGGMMVGSILGAAILNIGFEAAYTPSVAKTLAQIIAGAFIGTSIGKQDLYRLRHVFKPAAILLSIYLALDISYGFILSKISSLNLVTALFCAVPGGISDIPLIAADMGADAPKVVIMQFIRLLVGIGIFPGMINIICKDEVQSRQQISPPAIGSTQNKSNLPLAGSALDRRSVPLAAALGIAFIFGSLGQLSGIPAGSLVLSLVSMIVVNLLWGKVNLPANLRQAAQILAGAYIGSSFSMADLFELRLLILPAVLLVLGYSINCFLTGKLLWRFCGMSRKEGMLAAIPAGASDMALIAMDMGIQSADLVMVQIIRLVVVSSVFPQIISLVLIL